MACHLHLSKSTLDRLNESENVSFVPRNTSVHSTIVQHSSNRSFSRDCVPAGVACSLYLTVPWECSSSTMPLFLTLWILEPDTHGKGEQGTRNNDTNQDATGASLAIDYWDTNPNQLRIEHSRCISLSHVVFNSSPQLFYYIIVLWSASQSRPLCKSPPFRVVPPSSTLWSTVPTSSLPYAVCSGSQRGHHRHRQLLQQRQYQNNAHHIDSELMVDKIKQYIYKPPSSTVSADSHNNDRSSTHDRERIHQHSPPKHHHYFPNLQRRFNPMASTPNPTPSLNDKGNASSTYLIQDNVVDNIESPKDTSQEVDEEIFGNNNNINDDDNNSDDMNNTKNNNNSTNKNSKSNNNNNNNHHIDNDKDNDMDMDMDMDTTMAVDEDNEDDEATIHQPEELFRPIKIGKIKIIRLGTIDPRPDYRSEKHIFPIGFCSIREYASYKNPQQTTKYKNEILDGGDDGPLFRVTPKDDPEGCVEGRSSSGPWAQILKRVYHAQGHYSREITASGPVKFGLSLRQVRRMIMGVETHSPEEGTLDTDVIDTFASTQQRRHSQRFHTDRRPKYNEENLYQGLEELLDRNRDDNFYYYSPFDGVIYADSDSDMNSSNSDDGSGSKEDPQIVIDGDSLEPEPCYVFINENENEDNTANNNNNNNNNDKEEVDEKEDIETDDIGSRNECSQFQTYNNSPLSHMNPFSFYQNHGAPESPKSMDSDSLNTDSLNRTNTTQNESNSSENPDIAESDSIDTNIFFRDDLENKYDDSTNGKESKDNSENETSSSDSQKPEHNDLFSFSTPGIGDTSEADTTASNEEALTKISGNVFDLNSTNDNNNNCDYNNLSTRLSNWSVDDVKKWISQVRDGKFEKYVSKIDKEEIDGESILLMNIDTLRNALGMSYGMAAKLYADLEKKKQI